MAAEMESNRNVPVKDSDINKAVSMLYQSIEGLESRVSLLITRLNAVLCSKPKCAETKKGENALSQCELAKAIRGASDHIDKIQGMVNDTLEDLEI